ncbi:MAG: DUF1080 domain-containing protein [Acidobacteriota bacterium]
MLSHLFRSVVGVLAAGSLVFPFEGGFISLFDGKTLKGWIYVGEGTNGYHAQEGILICPDHETGNLFSEQEYADFVLRFEFRLEEGSNNGLAIRSPLRNDAHLTGMEIQILDDGASRYRGILKPTQYHGSLYGVFPAKSGYLKPVGEWNQQEVRVEGSRVRVTLNGTVILDADLSTVSDPAVLKAHPGLRRSSGHVGFLGHKSRVEFRHIEIKELPTP